MTPALINCWTVLHRVPAAVHHHVHPHVWRGVHHAIRHKIAYTVVPTIVCASLAPPLFGLSPFGGAAGSGGASPTAFESTIPGVFVSSPPLFSGPLSPELAVPIPLLATTPETPLAVSQTTMPPLGEFLTTPPGSVPQQPGTPSEVPEPGTLALFATALAAMVAAALRSKESTE